jgi:hypothetical protein
MVCELRAVQVRAHFGRPNCVCVQLLVLPAVDGTLLIFCAQTMFEDRMEKMQRELDLVSSACYTIGAQFQHQIITSSGATGPAGMKARCVVGVGGRGVL